MNSSGDGQARQAPFVATVVTAALVGLLLASQAYMTIPLMPHLAEAWHTSQSSAAWATTAFAIAYACGSLISGPVSDRYGRRFLVAASIALMAVATALLPLAGSMATGCAIRAVQGLLAGVFAPVVYAYLGERLAPRHIPVALTAISAVLGGALVFGQVAAQLVESAAGWSAVFWVCAPLLLIGALALGKVMLPDAPAGERHAGHQGAAPTGTLRSIRLVPLFVTALAVLGCLTAVYTGVQLYGPPELVGNPDAMLVLRACALPALLVAIVLAPRLAGIPPLRRAAGALVVAAVGMLGAAGLATSTVGLGIALFVAMLGASTAGPALVEAVGNGAGAARGTAIAVYSFILNLGAGLGAQLPLALDEFEHLALLLAVVCALGVTLVALAARRSRAGARAAEVPEAAEVTIAQRVS